MVVFQEGLRAPPPFPVATYSNLATLNLVLGNVCRLAQITLIFFPSCPPQRDGYHSTWTPLPLPLSGSVCLAFSSHYLHTGGLLFILFFHLQVSVIIYFISLISAPFYPGTLAFLVPFQCQTNLNYIRTIARL